MVVWVGRGEVLAQPTGFCASLGIAHCGTIQFICLKKQSTKYDSVAFVFYSRKETVEQFR